MFDTGSFVESIATQTKHTTTAWPYSFSISPDASDRPLDPNMSNRARLVDSDISHYRPPSVTFQWWLDDEHIEHDKLCATSIVLGFVEKMRYLPSIDCLKGSIIRFLLETVTAETNRC